MAADGSQHLVVSANTLPWDPAFSAGRSLTISGSAKVISVTISDDPAAAPLAHREYLPSRFDSAKFNAADGMK